MADSAPQATRPTDVIIVTIMALIAALGDVTTGVAYLTSGPDGTVKAIAYLAILVGLVTVVVAALLFTGSRVARAIIGIVMIVRIAFQVWAWIAIGSDHAAVAMLEILIAAVVLILLYSRETNAFLAGSKT